MKSMTPDFEITEDGRIAFKDAYSVCELSEEQQIAAAAAMKAVWAPARKCPFCEGDGSIRHHAGPHKGCTETCPVCEGTGYVRPRTTVASPIVTSSPD